MKTKKKKFQGLKFRRLKLNGYLHKYAKKRGVKWSRYSKPSKLIEETGELLEAIGDYQEKSTPRRLQHIKEEAADVLFCLLGIAEANNFDLMEAVDLKIDRDTGRNGGS